MTSLQQRQSAIEVLRSKILDIGREGCGDTQNALNEWEKPSANIPGDSNPGGGDINTLTRLLKDVWHKSEDVYLTKFLQVLADATREQPMCRILFGKPDLDDHVSILVFACHAAREHSESGRQSSSLQSLLKLIANCCADNDVNRRDLIEHGGLRDLLVVAANRSEVDILIPTLYNICSGNDDDFGTTDDKAEDAEQTEAPIFVPIVSKLLAEALGTHSKPATFEILLHLSSKCSEDRKAYLAELVEMAALPATSNLSSVIPDGWNWSYSYAGEVHDTLASAIILAAVDSECQVHVLRSVLFILSQESARIALFTRKNLHIWSLVQLVSLHPETDGEEPDEYEEELVECRKQFSKIFYELTSLQELAADLEAGLELASKCYEALSAFLRNGGVVWPTDKSSRCLIACCLTILAQLAASAEFRDKIANQHSLPDFLVASYQNDQQDIVYPAVMLVSRLALGTERQLSFLTTKVRSSLQSLLNRPGLGLTIPFETIHAYKAMIHGRPYLLPLFVSVASGGSSPNSSTTTIQALVELFDRTIEAGTKLAVASFVVELLRVTFPITKEIDRSGTRKIVKTSAIPADVATMTQDSAQHEAAAETTDVDLNEQTDLLRSCFRDLLSNHELVLKLAEVLAWQVTAAEPASSRVHGWFGFGILSVYNAGCTAILNNLESSEVGADLYQAMLNVGTTQKPDGKDTPVQGNVRLLLTQLSKHIDEKNDIDLGTKSRERLSEAAKQLDLNLTFGCYEST